MNNLSSYSGLVDAKIRASDKDLPVPPHLKKFKVRLGVRGPSRYNLFNSINEFLSKSLMTVQPN
jgi:hypothetical protein